MKAWAFTRRGQPLNVLQLTDIPTPDSSTLKSDELLIKVSHASLNLFSSILTWVVPMFIRTSPSVAELDLSGRVVAKGTDAGSLSVGDDVFGVLQPGHHIKQGRGTLAEYVIVQRDEVVRKPDNVSLEEAAGLGTVGVTGYFVVSKSGLKPGDRVFINGGSGGAGLALIQAAREVVGSNGKIVTTCSAKNVELVKSFGADEVIDYTQHKSVAAYLKSTYSSQPFDAILDAVGNDQSVYNSSPAYLIKGKPFLTIGTAMGDGLTLANVARNISIQFQNNAWPTWLGGTPRSWAFVDSAQAGPEFLSTVSKAVEQGRFKGKIDSVFAMEDAKKAIERMSSRKAQGKVLVKVQDL
jgi:reticulon-4-interacting protein 1, mitochondrial